MIVAMNLKERQRMERLEAENRELRDRLDRSMDVYREQALELIDLRTKIALVRSALGGEEGG